MVGPLEAATMEDDSSRPDVSTFPDISTLEDIERLDPAELPTWREDG
jgi:hypothetical protein